MPEQLVRRRAAFVGLNLARLFDEGAGLGLVIRFRTARFLLHLQPLSQSLRNRTADLHWAEWTVQISVVGTSSSVTAARGLVRSQTLSGLVIDIVEPTSKTVESLQRLDLPAGVDIEIRL